MSFLIFLGCLAGIVAFAFIGSRITGARCHYLDEWKPDEGETILFEDRDAQLMSIPKMTGRGPYLQPKGFVVVTDKRVLAGQRPIFSSRLMIEYILYPGHAPGHDADSIGGGLLKRGFQTLVVEPGVVHRVLDAKKPFVELTPSPSAASSFNLKAFRIYTGKASSFPVLHEPAEQAP